LAILDCQPLTSEILQKQVLKVHLALAETGEANYFCSCDDRLLHNAEKVRDLLVKVVDPITLIQEIEK
jgi:predicted nucleic acid-binding protein